MAGHRIELEELLALKRAASGLDLSSRRRVLTDLAGTHLSGFRGRGMEFEEHRRYVAGDEIRSIDWRVTARTGQTHVRSYREERERPVIIAVDLRPPMWFGSRNCFKSVLAARAAALFAWAADRNGDRVGGLILDAGHRESRPAGGRRGALHLFQLLCASAPPATGLPLSQAIEELRRLARPGALIILLSDLHDLDELGRQRLRLLSRHCELVLGLISDPLERIAPPPGLYPGKVAAQAPTRLLDTRRAGLRQRWEAAFAAREEAARQTALACRAHWLQLGTDTALEDAVRTHFGRTGR